MEMFQALVDGFVSNVSPFMLLLMLIGSTYGILIGILPGIGTVLAMALMLPLVSALKAEVALPFLLYIFAPAITAGAITSILVNVPGENVNIPTMFDGYPMTQKGEGPRALGAALTSSLMGGTASVFVALLVIPVLVVVVKAFGMPETMALILVGVAFVGVLAAGGGVVKGLIAGLFGFTLSFIGFQINTGVARFTFGSVYLYYGLTMIVFVLGVFAMPAVIEMAQSGSITGEAKMPKGRMLYQQMLGGAKDVFRNFWLWLRSMLLGFVIGMTPAIGAGAGSWMAYGQAAKTSKHPELFGTGTVEGVIAPESCNNATCAGSLLTTLAFGIPGSSTMIILLGAFIVLGITPGPTLLQNNLPLCFNLMWAVVLSNIVAVIIALIFIRHLLRVAYLSADYLVPVISVLLLIGVYCYSEQILDLFLLVIMGTFGYFMRRYRFAVPAMGLSFILGRQFERCFWVSLSAYGPVFLLRPIVLVLFAAFVYILFGSQIRAGVTKLLRRGRGET